MHVCVRKKGERSSDSHCVPVRLRKSSKEGDLKVIGTLDAYLGLKAGSETCSCSSELYSPVVTAATMQLLHQVLVSKGRKPGH